MAEKIKVLFVCLGNICRSPMAKAIMKHKIKNKQLEDKFYVDSCGTGPWHIGENADPRTITTLQENKIPIKHTARQINLNDLNEFDYIICMDKSNRRDVLLLGADPKKVFLMRDFDTQGTGENVPDPYYNSDGFKEVYEMLDRSIENFINFVLQTQ